MIIKRQTTDGCALFLDIEIPTADLIAELGKRRPCARCARNGGQKCGSCFWHHAFMLVASRDNDNFKEAE